MNKRYFAVLLAACLLAVLFPGCIFASANGTAGKKLTRIEASEEDEGFTVKKKKTYYYRDGAPVTRCWVTDKDGREFYFDADGVMATGKYRTSGSIYYFSDEGVFSHKISLKKKMIAITYDDGPSAYTPIIVNELKKVGGRATFFVVGERVNRYKKQMKEAFDAGCEIGNHSWSHPNLNKLSNSGIRSQITRTSNAIKNVTGVSPVIMRPPYGANSSRVKSAVGMPLITWNVDTLDWKTRSTPKTVSHVKSHAGNGSIVLMHDIHRPTAMAAKQIIPWLASRGYQLVTVSELADCRGGMKKGVTYSSFRKKGN